MQFIRNHSLYIFLALLCLLSIGLVVTRYYISGEPLFLFLIWNLFLAWIPLVLGIVLREWKLVRKNSLVFWGVTLSWLAFFPNAPYILTDFMHLKTRPGVPLWFDLLLISSFAMTGMLMGFQSLIEVRNMVSRKFSAKKAEIFVPVVLFLSAFGVYIGRYLRWNTWDIFLNPGNLAWDILHRFLYPVEHPRTWGFTLVFATLLYGFYLLVRLNNIYARDEQRNRVVVE